MNNLERPPHSTTGKQAEQQQDPVEFIRELFQEISPPVTTLWCALELAATRPPVAEDDRQDLMTSYALVETLAIRIRELQERADTLYFSRQER